ncbi:MAG: ADP-ribosylation factor-like protein [Candidatus Hodarchaeales archaeon]|jgi:GTPase SAR1 family protein
MPSQHQNQQIKIVILGLAESGKSTMIQSVIEGIQPSNDDKYNATINYQRFSKIINKIDFSFFDLGGQTRFLDRFTGDLSEFVFSDIDSGAFIFVLDALKVTELSRAKYYFELSHQKIKDFSPNTKIYIFINKMDLLPEESKGEVSKIVQDYLISNALGYNKKFETSVFSESIFLAIGNILYEVSGMKKRILPLLQNFIKKNSTIISQVILMTTEGAILLIVNNEINLQKLSAKRIRKAFISSIHQLSLRDDVTEDIILEEIDNELVSILTLMENGLSLMILISKKALTKNPSYSSAIYDLILSLSNQIINSDSIGNNKNAY